MINYRGTKDIYVTSENLPCFGNGSFLDRLDELFEFISSNNINLTFDTTHCAFSGEKVTEDCARFVIERISK